MQLRKELELEGVGLVDNLGMDIEMLTTGPPLTSSTVLCTCLCASHFQEHII